MIIRLLKALVSKGKCDYRKYHCKGDNYFVSNNYIEIFENNLFFSFSTLLDLPYIHFIFNKLLTIEN